MYVNIRIYIQKYTCIYIEVYVYIIACGQRQSQIYILDYMY